MKRWALSAFASLETIRPAKREPSDYRRRPARRFPPSGPTPRTPPAGRAPASRTMLTPLPPPGRLRTRSPTRRSKPRRRRDRRAHQIAESGRSDTPPAKNAFVTIPAGIPASGAAKPLADAKADIAVRGNSCRGGSVERWPRRLMFNRTACGFIGAGAATLARTQSPISNRGRPIRPPPPSSRRGAPPRSPREWPHRCRAP